MYQTIFSPPFVLHNNQKMVEGTQMFNCFYVYTHIHIEIYIDIDIDIERDV